MAINIGLWGTFHVHTRQELSTVPYIVDPGNLQGRSVRETGPKGATLVEVVDGGLAQIEHRALDFIRWVFEDMNLAGMENQEALLPAVRESVSGLTPVAMAALWQCLEQVAAEDWLMLAAMRTSPR